MPRLTERPCAPPRNLSNYANSGLSPEIASIRFEHQQSKRKRKLQAINTYLNEKQNQIA